jgi:hypothetical protein
MIVVMIMMIIMMMYKIMEVSVIINVQKNVNNSLSLFGQKKVYEPVRLNAGYQGRDAS